MSIKKVAFRYIVYLLLVSSFQISKCSLGQMNIDQNSNVILDKNNNPTPALLDLLNYFEIKHDGSLDSIVSQTQERWLRSPAKERWEINETTVGNKNQVMSFLNSLGCVEQIKPSSDYYGYVLVHGATAKRMAARLASVLQLAKTINFKKLIVLVGARPRDPVVEPLESFILSKQNEKMFLLKENWQFDGKMPDTEAQIAKLMLDQIDLEKYISSDIEVTIIEAGMQKTANGVDRRPTTGDTINQWLKTNPEPGKCLFISNNPYIGYQQSVARTIVPLSFSVETIGQAANKDEKIAIYLDSLARWLWQERQRINKK